MSRPQHVSWNTFLLWLHAMRPRTLPLAVSAIILGCALAAGAGHANAMICALAIITAVLLQILSNLANDYGDALKGADTSERVGPVRLVGSGLASARHMRGAIVLAAVLSAISGLALLYVAAWGNAALFLAFTGLGLASIGAAIAYTVGKKPYGYHGLGDVMSGIFFGPVAVLGSAVLCGAVLEPVFWLPALAAGLCSACVLNINNMRDIRTDEKHGKRTVAVRLGLRRAVIYHGAMTLGVVYLWAWFWLVENPRMLPALFLAIPFVRSSFMSMRHVEDAACLNLQLRNTALATAFLHVGMGGAIVWAMPL